MQIGLETIVRAMTIGTNWQKLRIGYRLAINDTWANIPGTGLVVGVSQGTIPLQSPNVTDFIGATMGNLSYANGGTLSRMTNSGVICVNPSSSSSVRKQGEIVTQGPGGSSSTTYISLQPGISHSVQALTITKIGTAYTMTTVGSGAAADVTRAAFLLVMENESSPPAGTQLMSSNDITGSAANIYDTVQIRWNKSLPTIEISDITVVRYY